MNRNKYKLAMANKLLTAIILSGVTFTIGAKEKNGVIMTVDGEDIPTEEFLYLYQKNNQQMPEPQSVEDYLNLFEVYRLKVAEAKSEGIDTTANFQKEMEQYRRELLEPYVADTAYLTTLVDIAAAREKEQVESSHIMIIRTNEEEIDSRNLALLDSVRTEILNGADFTEMARNYSQDKYSSDKGGYLGFTPAGTFPYGFETAVYETPEGEISEIIESHVGWHIVKPGSRRPDLEYNKPVKSYAEIREDVLRKTASPFDPRHKQILDRQLQLLKERHPELADEISGKDDGEAMEILLAAEEEDQYKTNPDYRNLVDEYTNGSLLYEVSVKNVWDKGSNDEEGLRNFFELNRGNYTWEKPHAKGILIQALNDSVAELIRVGIADLPTDSVVGYIKDNFRKEAVAEPFNVAEGVNAMIDNLMFGGEPAQPRIKSFSVYFPVGARIVDNPENLEDARSQVVTDYQEWLEKEWIGQLRNKHRVEVNKKELSRIKKKYK